MIKKVMVNERLLQFKSAEIQALSAMRADPDLINQSFEEYRKLLFPWFSPITEEDSLPDVDDSIELFNQIKEEFFKKNDN